MRPKTIQLTATTTAQNQQLGPSLQSLVILNDGAADVYVDFDNDATTTTGYKIPAGGTLSGDFKFINMSYITATGTATLYLIRVTQ